MSTTFFTSQRNAMKRDPSSGTTNLAAPATSAYVQGGTPYLYVTNYTIAHNLGKVPVFRYYSEPFKDGIVWPPLASRINQYATSPLDGTTKGPGITGWADSTNLYLQLFYKDNTLTGTYPVYWVIYSDFAL